ncbi:LysR family transcriptional regulator [Halotalea alkalilenta]|uniref:LysR family transcriptional regulator n=1 Tax=Halotalea alkalilenta TaxID=376489 RepID=UPI0004828393|nr:LysR family transcriptional regulator [Halotalea alkalilenta]
MADLDPNDLMIFARIVECGSFTRAAERLGIPKSTLSRRLLVLEEHLGERLLVRTTRKLSVTDFGQAILRHAQQLAAELEATREFVQNRKLEPSGHLRISVPGDFANQTIGPLLAQYVTRYPSTSIDVDVSQRRVDLVGENYDLAVRIGDLPDATMAATRVATLYMEPYASPRYLEQHGAPSHPDELADHNVLHLTQRIGESVPWKLHRGTDRWIGTPPGRISANSPGLLMDAALSDAGIARLARHLARPKVVSHELVRVLPEWSMPGIPVWVVFPGRRLLPTRTQLFIEALKQGLDVS